MDSLKPKQRQSTLEGVTDTHVRRDGNTTRVIDNAIQIIFSGKVCIIQDHWQGGTNGDANIDLFKRVVRRLQSEHHLYELVTTKKIRVDAKTLEIELLDE
jgi:hypothetical protein